MALSRMCVGSTVGRFFFASDSRRASSSGVVVVGLVIVNALAPACSMTKQHEPCSGSEEFLGQRNDDARGTSHVAESVLVLVLSDFADELGADGAEASDSLVDAFDCKHDAAQSGRVRRLDRR